jgi:SAM-dependent methyltransferase
MKQNDHFHSQHIAWEAEYQDPKFLSKNAEPIDDIKKILKFLRKESPIYDLEFNNPYIVDCGCGNGRHLISFLEQFGGKGNGIECSQTALDQANILAQEAGLSRDIVWNLDSMELGLEACEPESIDILLDITASTSLYEGEREIFMNEIKRTVKTGGIICLRTLCLDGDSNAKHMIKLFPGLEPQTYFLPEMDLVERVFTEKEIKALFENWSQCIFFEKSTNYQRWGTKVFKRRYIVAVFKKL